MIARTRITRKENAIALERTRGKLSLSFVSTRRGTRMPMHEGYGLHTTCTHPIGHHRLLSIDLAASKIWKKVYRRCTYLQYLFSRLVRYAVAFLDFPSGAVTSRQVQSISTPKSSVTRSRSTVQQEFGRYASVEGGGT